MLPDLRDQRNSVSLFDLEYAMHHCRWGSLKSTGSRACEILKDPLKEIKEGAYDTYKLQIAWQSSRQTP